MTNNHQQERLKQVLLANFADGDTWEGADALSITKQGALDIAQFFYSLALDEVLAVLPKENGCANATWNAGWNKCLREAREKITKLKEGESA